MIRNRSGFEAQAPGDSGERSRIGRIEDRLRYFRRTNCASLKEFRHCLPYHPLVALSYRETFFPSRDEPISFGAPYVGHLVHRRMAGDKLSNHFVASDLERGRGVSEDSLIGGVWPGEPG